MQVCWLRSRAPGQRETACEVEQQPATSCDFDVVEGITADEFERDYLSVRRPVLVRGAIKDKTAFIKKWTRWVGLGVMITAFTGRQKGLSLLRHTFASCTTLLSTPHPLP